MSATTDGAPSQTVTDVRALPAGVQIPAQRTGGARHARIAPPSALRDGFAKAALALGILGAVVGVMSGFSALPVSSAVAIVCAVLALRKIGKGVGSARGLAVWGLGLGVVGLLISAAAYGPAHSPSPIGSTTSQTSTG